MPVELPKIVYDAGATAKIRGRNATDSGFNFVTTERDDFVSSGGSSNSVVLDRNVVTYTGATYNKGYDLSIQETVSGTLRPGETGFVSLDPSIATCNSSGHVVRVSNGTARINYTAGLDSDYRKLTKQISLPVTQVTSSTYADLGSYVNGSLAKHISDTTDDLIDGLTPSVAKPLYSTKNHTTPEYVRNTGRWLTGVDLTCIPVWKTHWVGKFPCVLIDDDILLANEHIGLIGGSTIRFVTMGDVLVERTLSTQADVAGYDLRVYRLSSAVPGTITPCKCAPSNIFNYLPSWTQGYAVPGLTIDQESDALISDLRGLDPVEGIDGYFPSEPDDVTRASYYKLPISGDSCSGVFTIINNELSLLGIGANGGAMNYEVASAINAAIAATGSSGSITYTSLTGFTDFS